MRKPEPETANPLAAENAALRSVLKESMELLDSMELSCAQSPASYSMWVQNHKQTYYALLARVQQMEGDTCEEFEEA
jgi:hypothetical protein